MGYCSLKVTMYFFVFFNHLFFILGALIVAAGIWILLDKSSFSSFLQTVLPSFKVGVYILIGVGAITMVMGFLGCISACCGIPCLLGLYTTCLLLILSAQITAGLLLYLQQSVLQARMAKIVRELIHDYNPIDGTNRTTEIAWDNVQIQLSCCGWTGPENWKINSVLQKSNQTYYPCSCGNNSWIPVGFCPLDTASPSRTVKEWPVTNQGCKQQVQKWWREKLDGVLGVCIGVAITEMLGVLLSVCLCKSKKPG